MFLVAKEMSHALEWVRSFLVPYLLYMQASPCWREHHHNRYLYFFYPWLIMLLMNPPQDPTHNCMLKCHTNTNCMAVIVYIKLKQDFITSFWCSSFRPTFNSSCFGGRHTADALGGFYCQILGRVEHHIGCYHPHLIHITLHRTKVGIQYWANTIS